MEEGTKEGGRRRADAAAGSGGGSARSESEVRERGREPGCAPLSGFVGPGRLAQQSRAMVGGAAGPAMSAVSGGLTCHAGNLAVPGRMARQRSLAVLGQ